MLQYISFLLPDLVIFNKGWLNLLVDSEWPVSEDYVFGRRAYFFIFCVTIILTLKCIVLFLASVNLGLYKIE